MDALTEPLHAVPIVGRRVVALVERVVDHQTPTLGVQRVERVVADVVLIADVAEDHFELAPTAAPSQLGCVDVLSGVRDAEFLPQQALDHAPTIAQVVEVVRGLQHAVHVDADQLQRNDRVVDADLLDLTELPGPVVDLAHHLADLTARNRAGDAAVVERGEPAGGQVSQRRHARRQRRQ